MTQQHHGVQFRTSYILVRTDGEPIPAEDAHLLKAAPELLAALETTLRFADFTKTPCAEGRARTAIAKAKGTSHDV